MHGRCNTQTALVTLLSALKLIQEILPRRHSTAQHNNHTHHNALAPSLQGKLVCPHDTSAGGQVTASTTSTCRRTRLAPSCTQRLVATQDVYNPSSPNRLLFWWQNSHNRLLAWAQQPNQQRLTAELTHRTRGTLNGAYADTPLASHIGTGRGWPTPDHCLPRSTP